MGRDIRTAFKPRPGWKLVVADYSQIELRLLAHMSQDEVLVDAFRNGEILVAWDDSAEKPIIQWGVLNQSSGMLRKRGLRNEATYPVIATSGDALVLVGLLAANIAAFVRGMEVPWLFYGTILADMVVIGVGIVVASREVLVAERRTEASQARLAAIVDSAMDAVITVDDQQNIVLFNRAAEQVFGTRREEAIGRPLDRFIPQRFRVAGERHDRIVRAIAGAGRVVAADIGFARRDVGVLLVAGSLGDAGGTDGHGGGGDKGGGGNQGGDGPGRGRGGF